ncbi:pentapeptide repeat-containing protein [Arthrobacter sp.]|uniref:pentapeptide repeat-containing protein n=1 Tax=Arthrobacter sp. TaxID=1667 RepID=UPI0035C67DB2
MLPAWGSTTALTSNISSRARASLSKASLSRASLSRASLSRARSTARVRVTAGTPCNWPLP